MKAEMSHAVSDAYGVHIPKVFCDGYGKYITCDDKHKEEMKEAVKTCLTEEDNDDAWDFILEHAVIAINAISLRDTSLTLKYRIYQDGDVWLIPCGEHVKWVPDEDCEVSDCDLYRDYDAMLDDIYPECKIAGNTYSTSRALKEVDPTAYRCGFSDWLDSEMTDNKLVEIDGKYYRVSAKEPADYTDYWFEQDEHEGHYEWTDPRRPFEWIELQQP